MSDVLLKGLMLPLLSPLPRIMRPDDANVAGNVHGGTILKMIEEAGAIISTRHCNSQNGVSVCGPSPSPLGITGKIPGPGGLRSLCVYHHTTLGLGQEFTCSVPLLHPLLESLDGTSCRGAWFGTHQGGMGDS